MPMEVLCSKYASPVDPPRMTAPCITKQSYSFPTVSSKGDGMLNTKLKPIKCFVIKSIA